jgi:hypothetical protein
VAYPALLSAFPIYTANRFGQVCFSFLLLYILPLPSRMPMSALPEPAFLPSARRTLRVTKKFMPAMIPSGSAACRHIGM